MMKQIHILPFLLMLFVLVTCKKETNTPETKPFEYDPQITVYDEVMIPEDQVIEISNTDQLYVKKDINIAGELIITSNSDFTIISENGSINISGTIRMQSDSTAIKASIKSLKSANVLDGADLIIRTFNSPNKINITKNAHIESSNGKNAPDLNTDITIEGSYFAEDGGRAGDIILNSNEVNIETPVPGKSIFWLGVGGAGGSIIVTRKSRITGKYIGLVAGNGGRGGQVVIQAATTNGILSAVDMETFELNYIENGDGGTGGNIFWDNTAFGINNDSENLEYLLNADEIGLDAGRGGDGVQFAGAGGWVVYWCDRIINDVGEKVAGLLVNGGDGGNVVPGNLPIRDAVAGDGGGVVAWSNSGWNGNEPFKNGADGGGMWFTMGSGGHVQNEVESITSKAGDGGHSELERVTLLRELKAFMTINAPLGHMDLIMGIHTGDGGNGFSNCGGCRAGNGGNSGKIWIGNAGDGGNVYNSPVLSAKAGNGGDFWSIGFGRPGAAGYGKKAGMPGKVPEQYFSTGFAGVGNLGEQNRDGEWLGKEDGLPYNIGDEGLQGEDCGGDLLCKPQNYDTLEGCWQRRGSTYSWTYKRIQYQWDDNYEKEIYLVITEYGYAVNLGASMFKQEITQTWDYPEFGSKTLTELELATGGGQIFGGMSYPYCKDGVLRPPGENYTIFDEGAGNGEDPFLIETYTVSGCIPSIEDLYAPEVIERMREACNNSIGN